MKNENVPNNLAINETMAILGRCDDYNYCQKRATRSCFKRHYHISNPNCVNYQGNMLTLKMH